MFFKSILFLLLFSAPLFSTSPIVTQETVSPNWDKFEAHASTLLETKEGTILAAFDGGFEENGGIWVTRYENKKWIEPKEITFNNKTKYWNPVLTQLPNGEVLLFYKVGLSPRTWLGIVRRSLDEGQTWTTEEILPAGIIGPTKGRPIITEEGVLICASSIEVGEPSEKEYKATACWIELGMENGRKWQKIGPLELHDRKFGVMEPTLFKEANGTLTLFCRDRANKIGLSGSIWKTSAANDIATWSPFENTGLPNPDSSIDVLKQKNGLLLLAYNHDTKARNHLKIVYSLDEGRNWKSWIDLEKGEFPTLLQTNDQLIHVLYCVTQDKQKKIKHAVLYPNNAS